MLSAEGGGLYSLGLIRTNHCGDITEYLLDQVKDAVFEQIQHGGCLGLGLAAMGMHRADDVHEQLMFFLYQEDDVTGEAAGLAMGLCELISKSVHAIEYKVAYAQETQPEKKLAVGSSFVMYGGLEEADPTIESHTRDKDVFTITMAYCGTGDNSAIRELLYEAVSDVEKRA